MNQFKWDEELERLWGEGLDSSQQVELKNKIQVFGNKPLPPGTSTRVRQSVQERTVGRERWWRLPALSTALATAAVVCAVILYQEPESRVSLAGSYEELKYLTEPILDFDDLIEADLLLLEELS